MRVGIFGGSFDPVHNGHIEAATNAWRDLHLDLVVFVPAARQPFKPGGAVASAEQRFAMVELAIAAYPQFAASRVEVDRAGPSYTIDTLQSMHRQYGSDIVLIIGADALADLPRWHRAAEIPALARIAVIARVGQVVDIAQIEQAFPVLRGRVHTVAGPAQAYSSTDVRQRIAAGNTIATIVPPSVAAFIATHALYCI